MKVNSMSSIKESDLSEIDRVSTKLPGRLPLLMGAIRQQAVTLNEISNLIGKLSSHEAEELEHVLKSNPVVHKVARRTGITPWRFRSLRRNSVRIEVRVTRSDYAENYRLYGLVREAKESLGTSAARKDKPVDLFPETLSTRTVAKIMGVSPQMVRRYCQEQKLRATRTLGLAGDWHIDTQDFVGINDQYREKLRELLKERTTRNHQLVDAVESLAESPGFQEILDDLDARRIEDAMRRRGELND